MMEHIDLFIKLEEMKEMMGSEMLLDAIAMAMDTDSLEDYLRFIDRTNDLNIF